MTYPQSRFLWPILFTMVLPNIITIVLPNDLPPKEYCLISFKYGINHSLKASVTTYIYIYNPKNYFSHGLSPLHTPKSPMVHLIPEALRGRRRLHGAMALPCGGPSWPGDVTDVTWVNIPNLGWVIYNPLVFFFAWKITITSKICFTNINLWYGDMWILYIYIYLRCLYIYIYMNVFVIYFSDIHMFISIRFWFIFIRDLFYILHM